MSNYQDCLTVSSLNSRIRTILDDNVSDIWVKGEISNFHHHAPSGHMYFTLKDDGGELRCTMFRANNLYLKFIPQDGMEIRLFGSVTIYEKKGSIQLNASIMESIGIGNLFKDFEILKKSLNEEGLFDKKYKKEIPLFPSKVGVITSSSGAAYKDIINVLYRRSPHIEIIFYPAMVQGTGSAKAIIEGIFLFNKHSLADVIIVGRGGGSIEDLWTFNEESVARAIFSSKIPIISSVGHETDYTISDFVADMRAPTPSAGAEIAVPSREDLFIRIKQNRDRLNYLIQNQLVQKWLYFDQLEKRFSNQIPTKKMQIQNEIIKKSYDRLLLSMSNKQRALSRKLRHLSRALSSLSPNQILDRGYAIPIGNNGQVIRNAKELKLGDSFRLNLANSSLLAEKTSDVK
ncbi:MAG: exodeoxyribonuclease VII large subunit [Candidatus Neomarinimicrobiota bacterium]